MPVGPRRRAFAVPAAAVPVFVAGDHRDSPSVQGALASGRRAAGAVLTELRTG
ncbi:FAD-dependent oxidoreductase [Micromonospora peucetia]|uniref:FAD-dependent oxidoreductase n=1 Tax=Micromonospora peucetia TaxID=47871 RepID=UPI0022510459|nr:FAD-dependent oxidoreductase [Micromonospora peucetia]